jgi:mono/diheme cytochrome c family protein
MRRTGWFLSGAVTALVLLIGSLILYVNASANGFSARTQPTAIEALAARTARRMAIPADAKNKQNPIPQSDTVIAEARAHWADHCAACHANDGSGQVPMGQQMYPPAPDMRKAETQTKTDGELFYVIENGVRLTGMPGWGGSARTTQDSWKLVRFIRHLPSLSPAEIKEMESLNPKTPDDIEEEKQEEEFLKGGPVTEPAPEHHHHH